METKQLVGHIQTRSICGKRAASARACLRDANAERWHFVSLDEFAIYSSYQNAEETPIWVGAQLRELQQECRCAVATSDLNTCLAAKRKLVATSDKFCG